MGLTATIIVLSTASSDLDKADISIVIETKHKDRLHSNKFVLL